MFVWSYADKGKAVTLIADIKRSWSIIPNVSLIYDNLLWYSYIELAVHFLRFKIEFSVEWWKDKHV